MARWLPLASAAPTNGACRAARRRESRHDGCRALAAGAAQRTGAGMVALSPGVDAAAPPFEAVVTARGARLERTTCCPTSTASVRS